MMDRYILEALQKAVTTAVTATGSPPVKYVNRNFDPPSAGKWWEIRFIPNNLNGETWGSSQTYQGLLRLVLHWPMDDKGAYGPLDEVARVSAGFTKGSKFADPLNNVVVKISDNPVLLGVFEEPPELTAVISIRYSYFKP